jgi:hypothetical protein
LAQAGGLAIQFDNQEPDGVISAMLMPPLRREFMALQDGLWSKSITHCIALRQRTANLGSN